MNNLFQENKQSLILLLGLLFVLLVAVYFLFFRPLVTERELAETQVLELMNEVEVLQKQVDQLDDEPVIETDIERKRLEKYMPAQPELKEFLLSLQEIELVSESKITDYSFSYDGSIPERQANEVDENQKDNAIVEEYELQLETETEEVSPILELPGMPDNMRLVTVSMELNSPDYEHFQAFLQEIEKQERIMMISNLNFEQPGEMELLETEDESISASIEVTTFYYED